jgi:antitoxin component of MazEF toxin-antitoxin module
MKTLVQLSESGLSIPLPPGIVEQGQLAAGSELEITFREGAIVLTPTAGAASKLEVLVSQITDDNLPELVEWGPTTGAETW